MPTTENSTQSEALRAATEAIERATDGTGRILRSHFDDTERRGQLMNYLAGAHGMDRAVARELDWKAFKNELVNNGRQFGFSWSRVVARSGPLQMAGFRFPIEIGEELAQALFIHNRQRVDLRRICREEFRRLFSIADNAGFRVDVNPLREPIKSSALGNGTQSWVFNVGNSYTFELRIRDFDYPGSEIDLGELISRDLHAILSLSEIEHCQTTRRYGRFSNFDFQGFSVDRRFDYDAFSFHAIEMKANNRIAEISSAISQAANYRARAHVVWIAIPAFREDLFHDKERFNQMIEMCRSSGIGVISINFMGERYEGLSIVSQPVISEPADFSDLTDMVQRSGWERCPLCSRAVRVSSERLECGWKVASGESQSCMKALMEEAYLNKSEQSEEAE